MHRTVISLTDEQVAAIRRRCARTGQSMAAVIREAVEREVVRQDAWEAVKQRALEAVRSARFDLGGAGDVAGNHDEIWAEAIESEWRTT